MNDSAKKLGSMKGNSLFDCLPETALLELVNHCRIETFASGQHLIEENGKNDSLFLITRGQVKIIINSTHVGTQQAGETVGEISMLKISPPVADVIADGDVKALSFPTEIIDAYCAHHPDFATRLRATGMHKVYSR